MSTHEELEQQLCHKYPPYANLRQSVERLMANRRQGIADKFADLSDFELALDSDASLWHTARLACNRKRNRYADILANEPTRFKLCPKIGGSDYINANCINGTQFGVETNYIAAQAPTADTVEHWWAMIWQAQVNVIVMVSNLIEGGHVKGHAYWPKAVNGKLKCGRYRVSLVEEQADDACSDVMRRVLTVREKGGPDTRTVSHYQFVGWPDHGVPQTTAPLIQLLKLMDDNVPTGPVLVHCSAGVGRSGVLVTAHIVSSQFRTHLQTKGDEEDFLFDMVGTLCKLRRCRNHFVQTADQLALCYILVLHLAELLMGQQFPSAQRFIGPGSPTSLLNTSVPRGRGDESARAVQREADSKDGEVKSAEELAVLQISGVAEGA